LSPVPPTCSISCRVHIPLQPPNVPAPGEALLQARETSRFPPADPLFEAYHSFGPQRVVVTGLKYIALKNQMISIIPVPIGAGEPRRYVSPHDHPKVGEWSPFLHFLKESPRLLKGLLPDLFQQDSSCRALP